MCFSMANIGRRDTLKAVHSQQQQISLSTVLVNNQHDLIKLVKC